jgi:hypothetical protein
MNTVLTKVSWTLTWFLSVPALSGCGLSTPNIGEFWQGPDGTRQLEFEIKKRVYCDLRSAVKSVDDNIKYYEEDSKTHKLTEIPLIPDNWGAQISLLMQVDESTSLNPGVALTTPFQNGVKHFQNGNVTVPQSFSLGLGTTVSSVSTRIDKFDPYYSISFLRNPETKDSICRDENDPFRSTLKTADSGSLTLQSDLGLDKWLQDAMFTNRLLPSANPSVSPNKDSPDTVSIEIKFVVVTSANINPVWKLVPITANNGAASLLSSGRTRTHDLLITIGPDNEKTAGSHLASQIGQAVSSATRTPPD